MDGIMEVLRVGLEKIAQKVEQGVDETHEHQKIEVMRRKREAKEAGRKFKEMGVGVEVEELTEPVVEWG